MNIRSLTTPQVIAEMEQPNGRWQKPPFAYNRTITDMSLKINNILHDSVLSHLPDGTTTPVLQTKFFF